MFEGWSDDVFAAWLAGYFDGEGCIHLPKTGIGIDVSIASTTQPVIEAIHARIRLGIVDRVTFDRENWKTKFSWRLRRYAEAQQVLLLMRPYLTIKAAKADIALDYLRAKLDKTAQRHHLYAEVVQMVDSGVPRSEIAEALGVSRKRVDYMYTFRPKILERARKGGLPGETITYEDHGLKEKVSVRTSTDRTRRRWSLMSPDRVREIRTRLEAGDKAKDVAAAFGVHVQTVRDIGAGKTWKHVA